MGGFFLIFEAVRTASTTQVARPLREGPLRVVWRGIRLRAGLRGGGSGPTAHESIAWCGPPVHILVITTSSAEDLRFYTIVVGSSAISDVHALPGVDPPAVRTPRSLVRSKTPRRAREWTSGSRRHRRLILITLIFHGLHARAVGDR